MNKIIAIIAIAGLVGCTTPGELTKAHVSIADGKKKISLESHKDTVIESFERGPDGTIKITGYKSVANQGAIEASTAQAQMLNNWMMQNAEMFRQFGGLAAQYFSAGAVHPQGPQVITVTNFVAVPSTNVVRIAPSPAQ